MTELQREQIVGRLFPDWREHLNDGRVIDHILEGLTCDGIVFNRCSRPSCKNVARAGFEDLYSMCRENRSIHAHL